MLMTASNLRVGVVTEHVPVKDVAQEITKDEIVMRIVAKTAPLRQWEVEREMRARVKAALHAAGIFPAAKAD